jgi:hypothetical protein
VLTEEAQKGADAIDFRRAQPHAMYDGHDWWMSALKGSLRAHPTKPKQVKLIVSRIFISGSSTGLGLMAGQALV